MIDFILFCVSKEDLIRQVLEEMKILFEQNQREVWVTPEQSSENYPMLRITNLENSKFDAYEIVTNCSWINLIRRTWYLKMEIQDD